jgi:hypothetical protein
VFKPGNGTTYPTMEYAGSGGGNGGGTGGTGGGFLVWEVAATVMDIGLEICWKLALEFLITFRIAHSKFPSVVILILVPFVSSAV